jgi:aspartate/tyrosine/aromatic aminotransferase
MSRLNDVMGVTGRQTWSAAPRIAQHVLSELHGTEKGGAAWSEERNRLADLLTVRRSTFLQACKERNVAVNPSDDGFFAWYECSDPAANVAEACADLPRVPRAAYGWGSDRTLCAIPSRAR